MRKEIFAFVRRHRRRLNYFSLQRDKQKKDKHENTLNLCVSVYVRALLKQVPVVPTRIAHIQNDGVEVVHSYRILCSFI